MVDSLVKAIECMTFSGQLIGRKIFLVELEVT